MNQPSDFMNVLTQIINAYAPVIGTIAFIAIGCLYLSPTVPGLADWKHEYPKTISTLTRILQILLLISTAVGLLSIIFVPSHPSVLTTGNGTAFNSLTLTNLTMGVGIFMLGALVAVGGLIGFGRWRGMRIYFDKTKRDASDVWHEKHKRIKLSDDGELACQELSD